MAETIAHPTQSPQPRWYQRLSQNPIVLKELRSRMRGGRAFFLLTGYLGLISVMMVLVYFGFLASNQSPAGPNMRQTLGKTIFWAMAGMELLMVSFIAPALTAGAISSERERQTFDLLRTTLVSSRALVWGKLLSSLTFLLLLLFAAFPLASLAYMFGGVSIEEVFVGFFILVVTAFFYSALGLFYSSFMRRTLVPTVLAYSTAVLVVFGIPILLLTALGLFSNSFFATGNPSPAVQILVLEIGWLLISFTPLGAGLVTELLLIENQSLFYTTLPLNSTQAPVISPWISYGVIYIVLSLVLIALSVRFVRRVEQ